jgi:hypothetical protein
MLKPTPRQFCTFRVEDAFMEMMEDDPRVSVDPTQGKHTVVRSNMLDIRGSSG